MFAPLPKPEWGDPAEWETAIQTMPQAIGSGGATTAAVSICIVSHQNLALTRLCVESIFRLTTCAPFEVTVADNGSTDGTAEWLRGEGRVRALLARSNEGFPAACNKAVAATSAPIIAILNNDVVVTPQWLDLLVAQLSAADDVGMVGPVTNACGNEARVRARYRSLPSMLAFAGTRRRACSGEAFEIPALALFCAVIRRSTWEEVGPLDERFGRGLFEDDDYSHRLHAAGYRTVCREDAFVHHWGRAALRTLGEEEHALYLRNERLFREKWGPKSPR